MSLKPFGPFLKPYRVYCILGPAAKLAEAVLELYLPLLMAKVIDDGIAKGDTGYILKMGGVMLGIVTVGLLCALVSIGFCKAVHTAPRLYAKYLPNPLLRAAVGEMKKNEIVVVREELREYADLLDE